MSKNHLSSKIKLRPPLLFSSSLLKRLKYALAVKALIGGTDCTQIKQFRSSSNNLHARWFDFSKMHFSVQMKAAKQYFPEVLFFMLHKVVLTLESVDEILWCDHSNESY